MTGVRVSSREVWHPAGIVYATAPSRLCHAFVVDVEVPPWNGAGVYDLHVGGGYDGPETGPESSFPHNLCGHVN